MKLHIYICIHFPRNFPCLETLHLHRWNGSWTALEAMARTMPFGLIRPKNTMVDGDETTMDGIAV